MTVLAWSLSGSSLVQGSDPPPRVPLSKVESGEPLRGRIEGTATPGARIRLFLERPARPGSRFYWVQTDGPPIALEGQTGPDLRLTVPANASSLAFLLAVSDESAIKTVPFPIAVVARPAEAMPASNRSVEPLPVPRADAGDDAIGLVGRRVTLNGSESRPSDGLAYRWLQVDGPQVVELDEAGRFCSFVPPAVGQYRFALVVAHENRISRADFVSVSVGSLPGSPVGPKPLPLPGFGSPNQAFAPVTPPVGPAPTPLDLAVRQALANLDDAPVVAGPLAEVFHSAALRMDLYRTYGEIFSEISRRLDAVVPADPVRRGRWNALLFEPLTTQTVGSLLPLGLDLRVPGSQETPLTGVQKQELRGIFERLAQGLAPARAIR